MGKCCNPYRLSHTKKQQESTKPISDIARCRQVLPNFPWTAGQELCVRCRMKMLKSFQILEVNKKGVQIAQKKKRETLQAIQFQEIKKMMKILLLKKRLKPIISQELFFRILARLH